MKKSFSRRKFLQTSAISTAVAMIPNITAAEDKPGSDRTILNTGEIAKRRLGRTNRMVSCIGFGSGSRFCNWYADEDYLLQKLIDYAIKLGITYFDCARGYGNGLAEERYGKYLIPKYRNQIFLNSKTQERTYDGVMKDIEISLKTLKTNYLDLYCMHGIDKTEDVNVLLSGKGGYKAFLKLKNEGVVKNIGFSFHKWNEASQKAFDAFDVDAILCVINAAKFNGNEDGLLPLALKRDIGVIAIKVMGQNALIGNVSGDELLRYALSLPISVANIGIDGFSPLQACAAIGNEPVLSEEEANKIVSKLNYDPKLQRLPYYTG